MSDFLNVQAASSANFTLSCECESTLRECVIDCLVSSFNANKKRVFVVVCSRAEQASFVSLLADKGLIARHSYANGHIWLKGADSFGNIPTIMFKQCRKGGEESLAGFCSQHIRFFVDGDYVSPKGALVLRAGLTNQDNAMTVYQHGLPIGEKVNISPLPSYEYMERQWKCANE